MIGWITPWRSAAAVSSGAGEAIHVADIDGDRDVVATVGRDVVRHVRSNLANELRPASSWGLQIAMRSRWPPMPEKAR